MKVSIVIPCYNEKNTIEKIVEAVRNAPLEHKEVIVVDDCSQDGTRTVLEQRLSQVVDRIIYHPVNRGREPPYAVVSRPRPAISSSFKTQTSNIIPKIIRHFSSRLCQVKQTPFLDPDSWAGGHIASFFSGTWWATDF